jgi:hypothetical protein
MSVLYIGMRRLRTEYIAVGEFLLQVCRHYIVYTLRVVYCKQYVHSVLATEVAVAIVYHVPCSSSLKLLHYAKV